MDNDSNGLTEFKVKGIVLYKREGVLMQVRVNATPTKLWWKEENKNFFFISSTCMCSVRFPFYINCNDILRLP